MSNVYTGFYFNGAIHRFQYEMSGLKNIYSITYTEKPVCNQANVKIVLNSLMDCSCLIIKNISNRMWFRLNNYMN